MCMYQNFVDQNFTSNEQNINFENTKSSQNAWTAAASPPAQCPRVQAGSSAGGHHLSLRRSAQPALPSSSHRLPRLHRPINCCRQDRQTTF